ncbi:hypothetical protein JXA85_07645 [Candidatus Woesearchaeota archaeon]|nr:hypothetical protein [Candidatus Woesearchaeota archaeon]
MSLENIVENKFCWTHSVRYVINDYFSKLYTYTTSAIVGRLSHLLAGFAPSAVGIAFILGKYLVNKKKKIKMTLMEAAKQYRQGTALGAVNSYVFPFIQSMKVPKLVKAFLFDPVYYFFINSYNLGTKYLQDKVRVRDFLKNKLLVIKETYRSIRKEILPVTLNVFKKLFLPCYILMNYSKGPITIAGAGMMGSYYRYKVLK